MNWVGWDAAATEGCEGKEADKRTTCCRAHGVRTSGMEVRIGVFNSVERWGACGASEPAELVVCEVGVGNGWS